MKRSSSEYELGDPAHYRTSNILGLIEVRIDQLFGGRLHLVK